jgi:hypothetical protein
VKKAPDDQFMVCHRLSKFLSLHNHIQHLIRVARSTRLQRYLLKTPSVVLLPPHPSQPIKVDLTKAAVLRCIDESIKRAQGTDDEVETPRLFSEVKNILLQNLVPTAKVDDVEIGIHAELNLLLHHLKSPSVHCYNYFGVSKLCCFLCDATFRAYRKHNTNREHPNFYAAGTHGKIYSAWAMPNIFSEPAIQDFVCDSVKLAAEMEIIRIGKKIRYRSSSDSSAASGGSDTSLTKGAQGRVGEQLVL